MKTAIDQLSIELCKKLIETAEKLPSNVQLYWARNEEKLLETLGT
jgi:hypothetical protein